MPRFVSLVFASLVIAACSSDDDPAAPNSEQVTALAKTFCDGVAMKTEPCFDEDDRKEADECMTKTGICAAYRFVPTAIDNLAECYKTFVFKWDAENGNCFSEPEERGEDQCQFETAEALPADPAYDAFATKCQAKYMECATGDGHFSNDYCDARMKLFIRDFDDFAKCLDEPCEQDVIRACFKAKINQAAKSAGAPDFCLE